MEKHELAQRIGRLGAFAISQTSNANDNDFVTNVIEEFEAANAAPPAYPEAVEDAGEILKSFTENQALKDLVDSVVDLAVHDDDERWHEEIADAIKAFNNALRATKNRRRARTATK